MQKKIITGVLGALLGAAGAILTLVSECLPVEDNKAEESTNVIEED